MTGTEAKLIDLLNGSKVRLCIPVYQRSYDWETEQCKQFLDDLCSLTGPNARSSHFFGCITCIEVSKVPYIERWIVDGQQRLTTVILFLLALVRLLKKGKKTSQVSNRASQIMDTYLLWENGKTLDERIKLLPIESDQVALRALYEDSSVGYHTKLTDSYNFFYEQIKQGKQSVDELYEALGKLEVVAITLDRSLDDPQRVFESLNSTGMPLSESDKIRNFLLMNPDPIRQKHYYVSYWTKIEATVQENLDDFFRDYLSVKQPKPKDGATKLDKLYSTFKAFILKRTSLGEDLETILKELLDYAGDFKYIITNSSRSNDEELHGSLLRLNRLEVAPVRPFLLALFHCHAQDKLPAPELTLSVKIAETYICRRALCGLPSNVLTKVFLRLCDDVANTEDFTHYSNYLANTLCNYRYSHRFPDDSELQDQLTNHRNIYNMRRQMRDVLFERLERFDTSREAERDVYSKIDDRTYTIEHVMPQNLTSAWREELGVDADNIHNQWKDRLANLTLTAYNPELSDRSFREKCECRNGYQESLLSLNKWIAKQETWNLQTLERRNDKLIKKIQDIWPYPKGVVTPAKSSKKSPVLTKREALQLRYWESALPIIRKRHAASQRKTYSNIKPARYRDRFGFVDINGCHVTCGLLKDGAWVDLSFDAADKALNKQRFDRLAAHKAAIEQQLGCPLEWHRNDEAKSSAVKLTFPDVDLNDEAHWPQLADLHASWSDRLCSVLLPYLQDK